MYGTVFRARVKAGRIDDLIALMKEWETEREPNIDGALGGLTYKLDRDPNEIVGVAIFRDKASYVRNADNPEQDKWFRRFRELLEGDPEWNDGEIVQASGSLG